MKSLDELLVVTDDFFFLLFSSTLCFVLLYLILLTFPSSFLVPNYSVAAGSGKCFSWVHMRR